MENEKRLIDVNEVIRCMQSVIDEKNNPNSLGCRVMREIIKGLELTPTVDAVEVVRCKNCKHCKLCYPEKQIGKEPTPGWYCKEHKSYRKPDAFCSYGERREGE